MRRFPRAEALDCLEHLACRLNLIAALMTDAPVNLNADAVFGLSLIFLDAAGQVRRAQEILAKLLPVN